MKLSFNVDDGFKTGLMRLSPILGYELGEGTEVRAVQGERVGAFYDGERAVIYYKGKHHFWRALASLVDHIKRSAPVDSYEDTHFDTLGVMICVSRGMVPTVKTLEKYIDYLAIMGYNLVMLQTDDLFELEGRPYFGYMRGRYTKDELRAFDDYAYGYGIEAIPCIECYAHMKTYLIWGEAAAIKDTPTVLLAREEKTFEFVEEMIKSTSECFRSRRIHIGMDEAWNMGRGKFLDKHGLVPILDIFNEYMERLIQIIRKYSLRPMMWSDMYFRTSRGDNAYYSPDTVIPESTKAAIPEDVELVFWHYGEEPECDYYMLEQHKTLNRPIIYAGGLWDWSGHLPNNDKAYEATSFSVGACRAHGVHEMMTTTWFIDSECDMFATLLGLSDTAALAYNVTPSKEYRSESFCAACGGSFEAFSTMSRYHNKCDGRKYPTNDEVFIGKHLFWQDIMEGLYDTRLFDEPMSAHYADACERMKKFRGADRWDYLYEYAEAIFAFMADKCLIAENLVPAYKSGNKAMLEKIAEELLPRLKTEARRVHAIHRDIWLKYNKDFGFINNDIHYGGLIARIDFAEIKIKSYLAGECERLDELEEERLEKPIWAFSTYSMIATPTQYI